MHRTTFSKRRVYFELLAMVLATAAMCLIARSAHGQVAPLACNINLGTDALSYPQERVLNVPTFDLSANLDGSGDEPKSYALLRDELNATTFRAGTYFQSTNVWIAPTSYLKYPPEAALVGDLPGSTSFYPQGDYERRRGMMRVDLTQQAVREAWAKVICRYVTLRDADVFLDGVCHPDTDGSSAPVSTVTGRKMVWADECDLIRRVVQRVGPKTRVSCNVAQSLGFFTDADLDAFIATGARGITIETPWLNTRFVPRTFVSFTNSMKQAARFANAGVAVGLIPWVQKQDGWTDAQLATERAAEAERIAYMALLARRDAYSPIYVARPFQTDPEWTHWAERLGAPSGPARPQPYLLADGTVVQAYRRSFAGGTVAFIPATQTGEIRWTQPPASQPSTR